MILDYEQADYEWKTFINFTNSQDLIKYICKSEIIFNGIFSPLFIGVTCLFIASKIEEIYPPKLQEFAYVTDGACAEEDILNMELVVLKQMNWSLTPRTANAWSKLILQIDGRINSAAENNSTSNQSVHSLIKPSYCGLTHSKIMHLVDLCMLDINALNFSYASLAASASYFVQESPLPPGKYHFT